MTAHAITPHTSPRRDALSLLAAAALSLGVLWFASGAASGAALDTVIGAPRTHDALASRARETRPANYGELFTHVVAPLRTDVASSIRSIRIEGRDLLPLRWGWGSL